MWFEKQILLLWFCFSIAAKGASAKNSLVAFSLSAIYQTIMGPDFFKPKPVKNVQISMVKILQDLMQSKFPINRIEIDEDTCFQDLLTILVESGKGELWAQKYLDSIGTKPSGTLAGAALWYGEFDECLNIGSHTPDGKNYSLTAQYCRLALMAPGHSDGPTNIINLMFYPMIGVCVPTTCNLELMADFLNPYLENSSLAINQGYSQCYNGYVPYSPISIVVLTLFSLIGVVLLVALSFDVYSRLQNWSYQRRYRFADQSPLVSLEDGDQQTATKQNYGSTHDETKKTIPSPRSMKYVAEICVRFSPLKNFEKIISLPEAGHCSVPNFSSTNCLRTLSLLWVILGHTYFFPSFAFDNTLEVLNNFNDFSFMFVPGGYFAVDSFLFLSGFFAYWSMAKYFQPGRPFLKTLGTVYLHRYIRLTVPYLAMILVVLGVWPHLNTGPFWYQQTDEYCAANWWTNILYLNNFINDGQMCVGWSWYLAVDMQLFVITPFIVYAFGFKPRYGWILISALLLSNIVTCFALTYQYNLPNSPVPSLNMFNNHKDFASYPAVMYDKPYTRAGPYFVGLILAHLVLKNQNDLARRLFMSLKIQALCWFLAFGTIFAIIYGQYGIFRGSYVDPIFLDAVFNSFARPAWGIAIGWIFLACTFNQSGPVGKIMSWNLWAIPARLSYCAYLIHPIVLMFYAQSSRRPIHSSDEQTTFMFTAATFLSLAVALIFSLAFESPIVNLLKPASKK